ncbi:MAG TPA: pirin family protein [Burkholderiales bacterium]|nr:pirin family protein [Burkholderiales bacterium]
MLETLLVPRTRDLGDGFEVRRVLPAARRRAVGPFVFFDQMGPVALAPGKGLDVRPHPHIGLATVTYLFEGEILHRDSLGTVQPIRAGDVNWMTAGRGIAHSERTPPELRASGARLAGIQLWVGLPARDEETAPRFEHTPAARLPVLEERDVRIRLILGEWRGARSPVATLSPMLYADATLGAGATLELEARQADRAAYIIDGEVEHDGASQAAGRMLVFATGAPARITARSAARVLILGGEPLDAERFLWWNFVSSRKERIVQAAADWKARRFAPIPGETEFIPLPDNAPQDVHYP